MTDEDGPRRIELPPKPDGPRLPPHLAPRLSDTSPEVEAELVRRWRLECDERRFHLAAELTDFVVNLSKKSIQESHPDWTWSERGVYFVRLCFGAAIAERYARYLGNQPL